jgi:hypothetical protein
LVKSVLLLRIIFTLEARKAPEGDPIQRVIHPIFCKKLHHAGRISDAELLDLELEQQPDQKVSGLVEKDQQPESNDKFKQHSFFLFLFELRELYPY